VFAGVSQPGWDETVPHALEFTRTALSLPIFSILTTEEQEYVVGALREILKTYRR
jgi:dTDP-4-amino-4,6-dideoxygalactose transaminase